MAHEISPEDCRQAATKLVNAMNTLNETTGQAKREISDLVGGTWNTPKASQSFEAKHTEWKSLTDELNSSLMDFSNFLNKYANDVEALDDAYTIK